MMVFLISSSAINGREYDKVKYAILAFNRASLKARERRRVALVER